MSKKKSGRRPTYNQVKRLNARLSEQVALLLNENHMLRLVLNVQDPIDVGVVTAYRVAQYLNIFVNPATRTVFPGNSQWDHGVDAVTWLTGLLQALREDL